MNENNEVVKLLKQINSKLEKLNKLDKLDSLVEEITNRLYGSETENWALFIMKNYLELKGYERVLLEFEEIKAFNRMMEDKFRGGVDNYLVYMKDGVKKAFLIEAKHNLNKENVEKAIEQMKTSLNKISNLIEGFEFIPTFAFKTSSGLYTLQEAIEEFKKHFKVFLIITPDYRVLEVKNE